MTKFRKTIAASLAALTLGGAALATTSTPAAAWGGYGYGWHHGYGWGGPGIAAGVIGGLALGAVAAGAAGAYGPDYSCVARQPTYDPYGNFAGYRRVRVAC